MTWRTELSPNSRIVQVDCSDGISKDDWTMICIEIGFFLRRHGSTRILIDMSATDFEFAAEDLRALLHMYEEYRVARTMRSAIVVPGYTRQEDLARLRDIPPQHGYELALLDNAGEARRWLED